MCVVPAIFDVATDRLSGGSYGRFPEIVLRH
jgi:hypothetical protein